MAARTVLHGVDEACPSSKMSALLDRANHGSRIWDETIQRMFVFDGNHKLPFLADGGEYYSASAPRLITDNFSQATLHTNWTVNKGTDAQCVNFVPTAADLGYVKGTTGDVGSGTAADAVSITGPLNFKPSVSAVQFVARVKMDAVTNMAVFIGMHDTLASTLEMPFTLSGTTFTSTATDGFGFLIDTAATTDTIRCIGVATDTDTAATDTADAWAADTWKVFRLECTTAGSVRFYIDDVLVATIAACCTPTVFLCPIVAAVARTTTSKNCSVDFIACR